MFEDFNPPIWEEMKDEYVELTIDKTGYETFDSIYTQYLLMLGEFEILESDGVADFPKASKWLIWFYFFLATMFTNVIYFNSLVAVIGEAYNDLWQNKDRFARMQRTRIFADYITLLSPKMPEGKVIYFVEPVPDIDESRQEMMLLEIKQSVDSMAKNIESRFD